MNDEAPKKRGRPKKKADSKTTSLSAQTITVNNDRELEQVNAMIREALREVMQEKDGRSIDKEIAMKAMISTCSEFMKSFIIMGYDMENNAINPVFYAKNDLEADALSHYAQQYFVQTMKDMK